MDGAASDGDGTGAGAVSSSEPPKPPDGVPQYVVDGVHRQDDDTLEDLVEWIDEVVEHRRRREIAAEEVVDEDEELVDTLQEDQIDHDVVDDAVSGSVVLKEIPCGKEGCGACPHGPYAYRAYWRDGATWTEYLGRADEVL